MTDRSRGYRGKSLWEVWESQQQQRKTTASAKLQAGESKRALENLIQTTICNAEKLRPAHLGESKTEALSGIGKNRQEARKLERQQRQNTAQLEPKSQKASITYLHTPPEDGAFPDFLDDLFGERE